MLWSDKKFLFIGILFLLMVTQTSFVFAQNVPVVVSMKTIGDSTLNQNFEYNYMLLKGEEKISVGQVNLNEEGKLDLSFSEGRYDLIIFVDDLSTSGYDYYGKTTHYFSGESKLELDVMLKPIASVVLEVFDSEERPVPDALVRVDCSKNYGAQGYFNTDKFGYVHLKHLPVEDCLIRSAYGDFVIKKVIQLNKGDKKEVSMSFSELSIKEKFDASLFIFIAVLVCIVVLVFLLRKRAKFKAESVQNVDDDKSASKDDILNVLNKKEKLVIKYMLDEQNKSEKLNDFYVSQANIIYGAGIPKTSLSRILESLQKKNILHVERIGKMKKIYFTDWFSSK